MSTITNQAPIRLEAFDANGIHCGYATHDMRVWTCRAGPFLAYRPLQTEAEEWLRKHGAVTIKEYAA